MAQTISDTTTDHDFIRKWAEERNAVPARVKGTESGDTEMLRFDFPGYSGEKLEEISWEEFFDQFEKNQLVLLYQEKTKDGKKSNFFKFVRR